MGDSMGKVIVFVNLTLDGVMQAPARPDEDTRGDFKYGGWAAPYAAMPSAGEVMANNGALLLGRRTYMDFYSVWPKRTESPYSAYMDNIQKYVASRTLKEPLPWKNSTLLKEDVAKAVVELKKTMEKDIVIMGSGELIQSLMKAGVIDEYALLIHPLTLGTGRRLFPEGSTSLRLKLVSAKTTEKDVAILLYVPSSD
jgi:dihydrofolate reductase